MTINYDLYNIVLNKKDKPSNNDKIIKNKSKKDPLNKILDEKDNKKLQMKIVNKALRYLKPKYAEKLNKQQPNININHEPRIEDLNDKRVLIDSNGQIVLNKSGQPRLLPGRKPGMRGKNNTQSNNF
jgi:hypothetical protein